MEIFKPKETVEKILKLSSKSRDCDRTLIGNFWALEAESKGLDLSNFLSDFVAEKYTNPETIRRTRQKLQEEFKFYRGKKYQERQKLKEEVKRQVVQGAIFRTDQY